MAEQHRATDLQWDRIKARTSDKAAYSTILELLHRIEALEAAAKPNHPEKPDGSLKGRVAAAITGDGDEPINWKPEARAAIREVLDDLARWQHRFDSGNLRSSHAVGDDSLGNAVGLFDPLLDVRAHCLVGGEQRGPCELSVHEPQDLP